MLPLILIAGGACDSGNKLGQSPTQAAPRQAPPSVSLKPGHAGTAASPAPSGWRVLLDGRDLETPSYPELSPKEADRILSAVFPKRLESRDECDPDLEAEEDDKGQIVPRKDGQTVAGVGGHARGAFTKPGADQTVYVLSRVDCGVPWPWGWLAAFEGKKLVAATRVDKGQSLEKLTDLDQDGVQELLLSWHTSHMGETQSGAVLVGLSRGRFRTAFDFQELYNNVCDADLKDKDIEASVIYYVPGPKGRMPEFHRDMYRASCGEDSGFKWVSRAPLRPAPAGEAER